MSEDSSNPLHKSGTDKTTLFKPSLYGGRFTRKQYFLYMLVVNIIIQILSSLLGGIIGVKMASSASSIEEVMQIAHQSSLIVTIPAAIFFFMPIATKRAHDIGHKGTFIISLCCLILISQLLCFVSMDLSQTLYIIMLIPSLIYGCILLFKDSQKGTNEYGPSTKYPDTTA